MNNVHLKSRWWLWTLLGTLLVLGAAIKLAWPLSLESAYWLTYWGPWLSTLVLALALLSLAIFGKIQPKRIALACGLIGILSLGSMVLLGLGRLQAWLPPQGLGLSFSLSYVRQQLPALSEALYDGAWKAPLPPV